MLKRLYAHIYVYPTDTKVVNFHFNTGDGIMSSQKQPMKTKLRMFSPTATPQTSSSQNVVKGYEVGPWDMTRSEPVFFHDTWLRAQAQSVLGKEVTLEEAKDLFSRIDVTTRQPIPQAPSRLRRPSALRRIFGLRRDEQAE